MACSKVRKKGQITIPSGLRVQYGFREGVVVAFKETKEGLVIEPVPDITESAGKLSTFGGAGEVIRDIVRSREQDFR